MRSNPSPILVVFGVVAIIVGVGSLVRRGRGLGVSRTQVGPLFAVLLGVDALFLGLITRLRQGRQLTHAPTAAKHHSRPRADLDP